MSEACRRRLLIFAKAPQAGQVKTRLMPFLKARQAAALHAILLKNTVRRMADGDWASRLMTSPDSALWPFPQLARRYAMPLHPQHSGDLGQRMAQAACDALLAADYVVLIGTDCPAMSPAYVQQAFEALQNGKEVVLGPAEDGGYVLIGLRRFHPRLFADVAWGTDQVLQQTHERIAELGWSSQELAVLWDIDRPEDLQRYRQTIYQRGAAFPVRDW